MNPALLIRTYTSNALSLLAMSIALVNVAFTFANFVAVHVSVTPPRPTPDSKEQEKYRQRRDTTDLLSLVAWVTVPIYKVRFLPLSLTI